MQNATTCRVLLVLLSLLLHLPSSSFLPAQEPEISAAAVQVIRMGLGENADADAGWGESFPFNASSKGTKLALIVSSPKAQIIEVDIDNSKLEAFIDSTRKSLLAEGTNRFGQSDGFNSFPVISQDRKAALFSLEGSLTPEAKATKIGAKGSLKLVTATETTTLESKLFDLNAKTKVKVGNIQIEIEKVGPTQFLGDGYPVDITLQCTEKPFDLAKSLKFFDENGVELPSTSTGEGSFGFGVSYTYTKNFGIKAEAGSRVSMQMEVWRKLKVSDIAFSVSTGIGG